uniref:G_PROTEIN_RECEP_F1_2 domain-containing protein n=1 Tax=Heterorhabditis bacteriophora TaxID=37862 RepID=A0A1I7XCM2_HETBA
MKEGMRDGRNMNKMNGLAISDLMFLLLCVPFTAIDYALPVWIFPEWTCSMINFFQHISAYCSVWTLTLMALDRYLAVVYPVDSMTLRSPKNTIIALVVVYVIIMATQSNGSIRSRPETRRAKRKVTRLVSCVLIIWAVCWLPLNVCFFVSGLSYPETLVMKGGVIMVVVQISSQVLAYTNSCLNPILYALMSENFRKGFIRVIRLIVSKLTMGAYCSEYDKAIQFLYNLLQSFRMEFTTCNNTTMNSSIRRFHSNSKMTGLSERSLLLRDRTEGENKKYFEMAQISVHSSRIAECFYLQVSRTPSSKSFNL